MYVFDWNIFKLYMDEGKSIDNKDNSANQAESGIIEEKITQANGEVKIKKYSKGKALGRGGFAKCYEVTNLENKRVLAAKIIAKSSLNRSRAKQKVPYVLISANLVDKNSQVVKQQPRRKIRARVRRPRERVHLAVDLHEPYPERAHQAEEAAH